jgi:hypothetical protein
MNIEWGRRMRTYHDFRMANKDSDKTDSSAVQKTFEAGIVLFLSARDYTNEEVASMYFETESIERSFETAKTCDKMISFMGYAMKGFDGALLLSFAAAAVQALISCGLAGSNTDAATALDAMGHSMLHVYESAAVLEEFTEEQKEIMKCLNLDNPPFQCFA